MDLIKTTVKTEYGKAGQPYATIEHEGYELGFISPLGVFLRLYNPSTPFGVLHPLDTGAETKEFYKLCQFVEKHWEAIWDRYDFTIKHLPKQKLGAHKSFEDNEF